MVPSKETEVVLLVEEVEEESLLVFTPLVIVRGLAVDKATGTSFSSAVRLMVSSEVVAEPKVNEGMIN